jgi:hypothetical protein
VVLRARLTQEVGRLPRPWPSRERTPSPCSQRRGRRHHRAVHEEGYQIDRQPDGSLHFRRPDGRPLPEVPAPGAVPADPVQALRAANVDHGLRIHGRTACPPWSGERRRRKKPPTPECLVDRKRTKTRIVRVSIRIERCRLPTRASSPHPATFWPDGTDSGSQPCYALADGHGHSEHSPFVARGGRLHRPQGRSREGHRRR